MRIILRNSAVRTCRGRRTLVLGALLYALLGTLGSQMDASGQLSARMTGAGFLIRLPITLAVLFLLLSVILLLPERGIERHGKMIPVPAAAIILFLAWTPMFLIEYPGSFMYDTQRQAFQIAAKEYDAFHPLLHTLFLRACLSLYPRLQSIEKCAALYSLLQMAAMALCFSTVCGCVRRMAGWSAAWLCLLFYSGYPSHMAMASNCVKDALFSACFSAFLALCLEERLCGLRGGRRALCLLFGVLSCLLRNNMFPAVIVWALLLLLARRTRRAGLAALLIAGLSVFANEAMIRATGAERGSVGEMLSVPIQQLARARLSEEERFTEEEKTALDSFFWKNGWFLYEPTLADPVKEKLRTDELKMRPSEFARLWLSVGKKCPRAYLEAFTHLALPSLYPYRKYRVAQPYIETGLQPGVVSAPFGQPAMTQPARFAAARSWLARTIFDKGADDVPLLRLLMNTGAVFWMLLFCLLAVIASGRTRAFSVLLLPLLLYGTFLLGPVMQGRYLYPFLSTAPLFIGAALGRFPEPITGKGGVE